MERPIKTLKQAQIPPEFLDQWERRPISGWNPRFLLVDSSSACKDALAASSEDILAIGGIWTEAKSICMILISTTTLHWTRWLFSHFVRRLSQMDFSSRQRCFNMKLWEWQHSVWVDIVSPLVCSLVSGRFWSPLKSSSSIAYCLNRQIDSEHPNKNKTLRSRIRITA